MRTRSSLFCRRTVVGALLTSMLLAGCTRTTVHKVARFEPASAPKAGGADPAVASRTLAPTSQPVPKLAVWKVKVRGHGEKDYHGIDGTERLLQRGDVVGFRTGDDGITYAVANRELIPLALDAGDHCRVVWYASIEQPTQLGRNMRATGKLVADVATGAAILAAAGGMLWLALTAEVDGDDCQGGRH